MLTSFLNRLGYLFKFTVPINYYLFAFESTHMHTQTHKYASCVHMYKFGFVVDYLKNLLPFPVGFPPKGSVVYFHFPDFRFDQMICLTQWNPGKGGTSESKL